MMAYVNGKKINFYSAGITLIFLLLSAIGAMYMYDRTRIDTVCSSVAMVCARVSGLEAENKEQSHRIDIHRAEIDSLRALHQLPVEPKKK